LCFSILLSHWASRPQLCPVSATLHTRVEIRTLNTQKINLNQTQEPLQLCIHYLTILGTKSRAAFHSWSCLRAEYAGHFHGILTVPSFRYTIVTANPIEEIYYSLPPAPASFSTVCSAATLSRAAPVSSPPPW